MIKKTSIINTKQTKPDSFLLKLHVYNIIPCGNNIQIFWYILQVIPLSYLLPGWPEYISTFLFYLSHPASTVRQAASSVFKYLGTCTITS